MRELAPILWMAAAFAIVMPAAIWMSFPFQAAPDVPQDPTGGNSLLFAAGAAAFVLLAIGMAVFVLWVLRTGRTRVLKAIFLSAVAVALLFALTRPILWLSTRLPDGIVWAAVIAAVGLVLWRLWVRPGRLLTNAVGIIVAAAVAAVAGAILSVTPVLFLLAFIAVYDVVAVKRTKHMLKLAKGVTDLKLPVALHFGGATGLDQAARAPSASRAAPGPSSPTPAPTVEFTARPASDRVRASAPRRRGLMMGVGDLVFPSALVVAAADPVHGWGALPAAACALGVMAGYGLLVWSAWRGEPQPGLPLLNGGAVLGFFAGLAWATHSLRFW